jgi:tryptophan synthase alpha chain
MTGLERIAATFARRKGENKRVLVAYICIGDPSLDESVDLALACVEAGADILELGTPFSDPTADGPSIAKASQRALAAGGGFVPTLEVAAKIRARAANVPLVLFGYANPIFVRGEARAVDEAAEQGIDGLLIVDLPLEEGALLRERASERGLAVIPLLAPTSAPDRVARIVTSSAAGASSDSRSAGGRAGFVYYVSVAGVTGAARAPLAAASDRADAVRRESGLPVVIGFGIATAEDATAAARGADGVVVGTALVKLIESGKTAEERRNGVIQLLSGLRRALDDMPM